MRRARPSQLIRVLASAALLSACGSSGASSGSSGPTATGGSGKPSTLASPAAVARCKQTVAARVGLTASVKKQLTTLCQQAAHESPVAVREAAAKICESVIAHSALSGDPRTQALAACKAA